MHVNEPWQRDLLQTVKDVGVATVLTFLFKAVVGAPAAARKALLEGQLAVGDATLDVLEDAKFPQKPETD